MPKSRGFTLVELLITISIISILSAVGLVVYSSVMKQGRDSKRQSDLRSIQSALEQYYADNFSYPVQVLPSLGGSGSISAGGKTYLNAVPTDPTGKPEYFYTSFAGSFSSPTSCDNLTTKCTLYCLAAHLENTNPGLGNCSSIITSIFNNRYNFAVFPP